MVRARWIGTVVAALLGAGLAWGQSPGPLTLSSDTPVDSIITIKEPNQPKVRCKLVRSWREANGAMAYEIQVLATGEKMTIVQTVSGDTPKVSQENKTGQTIKPVPAPLPPALAPTPSVPPALPKPARTDKMASTYSPMPLPTQSNDWRQSWGKADDHKSASSTQVGLPHADPSQPDPLKNVDFLDAQNKPVVATPRIEPIPSVTTVISTEEEPAPTGSGGLLGVLRHIKAKATAAQDVEPPVAAESPMAVPSAPVTATLAANQGSEKTMTEAATNSPQNFSNDQAPKKLGLLNRLFANDSTVAPADAASLAAVEAESGNAFSTPYGAPPGSRRNLVNKTRSSATPPVSYEPVSSAAVATIPPITSNNHVAPDSQQLVAMVHDAPYPSQREWAAEYLAASGWQTNQYVVPALLKGAKEDPAATVRATCVRCLAQDERAHKPGHWHVGNVQEGRRPTRPQ